MPGLARKQPIERVKLTFLEFEKSWESLAEAEPSIACISEGGYSPFSAVCISAYIAENDLSVLSLYLELDLFKIWNRVSKLHPLVNFRWQKTGT